MIQDKADIICANPPYIAEHEWEILSSEVKHFEPKIALTSKHNGLFLSSIIFTEINKNALFNDNYGVFCMELDHMQPSQLIQLSNKIETKPQVFKFNTPFYVLPKKQWFPLADLSDKERFLSYIS